MKIRPAVIIRSCVFICALLTSIPLFARKAVDLLVMRNGDRLTCEVKSLNVGVLSVSLDYVDGTLSVNWSEVARLESSQLFVVLTEDGSSLEGTLATVETTAGVAAPTTIRVTEPTGKTVEVVGTQIVKMTQTSERFYRRFNGAINLGINYSKGNSATQYSFGTEAQYLRERWSAETNFNSNLSANSGSTTSTRNQLSFRAYRLLSRNNYFLGGVGDLLQSSVQGIKFQATLGGGIGRFLKNTNSATISVLGGVSWQGTDYNPSASTNGTQNIANALIAAEMKLFKFKKTNLSVTGMLLPALSDPGRVRFNANATYYLKLFNNLNWNVSFYGNWDNRPPAGFSGSDYGTSSGLSWTFGNR